MTITKGTPDGGPRAATAAGARHPERRSHVPTDGTPAASAVERARTAMLHEGREPRSGRGSAPTSLCEALLRQGVDVFFSYPGGVILPLYDVLGDYPELRHILVRHEQGGAHAADGYARVTGRVGVCMGTSGPGRHEPRHRHRDGAARLGPDGRDHRQRAGRADRQGRVPGDRHQRHHAADDQAQLPGPRRRRPAAGHRRGVPHRPDRPAGPGPHRHHQGRPPAGDDAPSTRPRTRSSPGCPASARTSTAIGRQLKLAAAEIAAREAAGHPGRPRRPPRRGLGRPARRSPRRPRSRSPGRCSGSASIDETHPLAYGYMGMHGWKHVNRAIQSGRPAHRDRACASTTG